MCSPIRSMAAISALASTGQQSRRAGERVAVGLGVDLDRAVGMDLGVEHVRAGAEVDDVEHGDVLAQLLLGDLERAAQLGGVEQAPGAPGVDQDAGQRDQPGEALRADGGVGAVAVGVLAVARAVAAPRPGRATSPARWPWHPRRPARRPAARPCGAPPAVPTRSRSSSTQLGRTDDAGVLTQAEHPGDQLARVGVRGDEEPVAGIVVLAGGADLAVAAEVALDLPGDAAADPHLGDPDRLSELPVDPVGVGPRVEVVGALEVVLGLGGVADLAADPREAEDPDRAALVRAADDVELAPLVQQLVGVDAAGADLVALHRVVVEHDRLAAEDGGLDLGQALGDVVAAGRAGDAERDRALLRGVERAWPPPGDLLEREPQRLGVGELAVEQLQRGVERGQLLVGERDGGEVEVLRRQRVVLLLHQPVDGLLDGEHDPQGLQLRAVGIEAACERVLVHDAVTLDVTPDLRRRHGRRSAIRYEINES